MSDQEMLELLAAEAPDPRPGYVDVVLVRARRARLRRRVTALGAGLGVVAVALIVATLVAPPGDGRQRGASAGTGPDTTQVSTASPNTDQPLTADAGAYAAAVKALADQVREGGPQWPILYVLDHTCANVVTPTQDKCDPQALSASAQRDLTAALATYAPVRFVADHPGVTGPNLEVVNGGVLVTLGRIQIHDNEALVPLSVRRNGLNGRGLTYRVTQGETKRSMSGGTQGALTWKVEGTVGGMWIS
jgi:hypothetical protein